MQAHIHYYRGAEPHLGLKRVLETSGSELAAVAAPTELPEQWTDDHVLVLDGSNDLTAARAIVEAVPLAERHRLLLFADVGGPEQIGELIARDGLRHIVPARASERVLRRVLTTLQERSLPSLAALVPEGVELHDIALSNSDEGKDAMAQLREALTEHGVRDRFVSAALTVTDEMLMNGLFDAPTDGLGNHLFVEHPRDQRVELPEDDHMTLTWAVDEDTLYLCVRDPYGSLPDDAVRANLLRATAKGADQIRTGTGGAGLGLYMLLDHLASWYTHVVPGQSTRVVGSLAARGSFKAQREAPRLFDLHYDLLDLLF
jgi:hypothetical protein